MDVKRETGRRFILDGETITTRRVADGDRLWGVLVPPEPAAPDYPEEIVDMAQFMLRGFHDWMFGQSGNSAYRLEPGFRRLIGAERRVVSVSYENLRADRRDDLEWALIQWEELGFEFNDDVTPETAEILIDDEADGAWFRREQFRFTGRKDADGKWLVETAGQRQINVSKEWPDWSQRGTMVHELGHALGGGHPGRYNGGGPADWEAGRVFGETDRSANSVMSYFGRDVVPGPADRCWVELLYGSRR